MIQQLRRHRRLLWPLRVFFWRSVCLSVKTDVKKTCPDFSASNWQKHCDRDTDLVFNP
jgi:hypothetical protein